MVPGTPQPIEDVRTAMMLDALDALRRWVSSISFPRTSLNRNYGQVLAARRAQRLPLWH
jgi:hypothetical protein